MAKLISLYRDDGQCPLGRRELPLPFDDNIAMVMKLPELNLTRLPSCLKGSEMELFTDKCKLLTSSDLNDSMKVSSKEVFDLVAQNVPCVGCRRSVERLFHELVDSGQDALYPVTLTENGIIGLAPEVMSSTSMLFILLKYYGNCLSTMVESITTKSRQTRRCPLHSLDAHRARPSGLQWRPLWDSMALECKEELTLVEADTLLDTLEAYLQKHRFCPECRLKVLRAYSLLVGEVEPNEEKGYKPQLYKGLKCCPAEKHIHVQSNTELISILIARAEPELVGSSSRRERHAKTMEVAQDEVVTCVGICLLERLQRVAQRLREEEQMVDMLQFASLQALRCSFELAVESKRGVSQLELLCEELSREEAAQKLRKEMKKLRRKKRRGKKEMASSMANLADKVDDDGDVEDEPDDEAESLAPVVSSSSCQCQCSTDKKTKSQNHNNKTKGRVNNNDGEKVCCSAASSTWSQEATSRSCYCSFNTAKHSNSGSQQPLKSKTMTKYPQDSGYCSANSSNLTTPEGSDVACTEGLCNHQSGSPVQCRPSPRITNQEGHNLPDLFPSNAKCNCNGLEESSSAFTNGKRRSCPVHFKLRENCCGGRSLQQMLDEWCVDSDEAGDDEESSYIPVEEVQAFRKQQQHYNEQRLQLRNDLRLKFDLLCGRVSSIQSQSN